MTTSQMVPEQAPEPAEALAKGTVTLAEVLFVSIAAMAPGAGAAYAIMSGTSFGGGGLPLSVLIALVGCLLVALAVGQLAKHMSSAAGFAAYVGTAFHPLAGFVTAWVYPLVYIFANGYLCLVFGDLLAGSIVSGGEGKAFTFWWVTGTAACMLGAFLMNYFGAKIGTSIGLVLGAIEIVVFVVLAIWMIVSAGDQNSASVLTTKHATVPGFEGMSGVIAASVYAFLAFIGFEAAAPLAAETKDPRRNIPRAIIGSTLIVGVFYVFTTYAVDVYFGSSKFADFLSYENGNGWIAISRHLWGAGWIILLITLLNSCLACANSGAMAGTRSIWAMAHARTLPKGLSQTHPRWRSPITAIYAFFGFAAIITFGSSAAWGPVTAYLVLGQVLTVAVLPIYIVGALACTVYYYRFRRSEMNLLMHVVIPVVAAAALVPSFLAGAGIAVFSFIAPLSWPLNIAGPLVAIWYVVGAVIAVRIHRRRPEDLEALCAEGSDLVPTA